MWAALVLGLSLVLWASLREQPFTPWKKTSVSRCSDASKRSWGTQSGGLLASAEVGRVTKAKLGSVGGEMLGAR